MSCHIWVSRRAEMGVAALIIFIALLLVATITAGVLIQNSLTLQQKALTTGRQGTDQVATHIDALQISGVDGQNNQLDNISMIMKLSPGSDPVVLEDCLLRVWDTTFADSFTYTNGSRNPDEFNVTYLQRSKDFIEGVISRGDVVQLDWTMLTPIHESQHFSLSVLPKTGSVTIISLDAPEVFGTYLVLLYP